MTLTARIAALRALYRATGLTLAEIAELARLERTHYENTASQRATARRIIATAKRGDRVFITDPRGGTIAGRVTLKHEHSLVIVPERDRWAKPIRATELNLV